MTKNNKKDITIVVSGGFDPIHIGHVRLFKEAKKLGDKLIVILNNDNWLIAKKGHAFMPENQRIELIKSMKNVDQVVLTRHRQSPKDMSVCKELLSIHPDIFANGGDRYQHNIPEVEVCKAIGCKMVFNIGGGKAQSSSQLLKNYCKEIIKK